MKTVTIVGGGISGLIASILMARAGLPCTLIEKKNFPQHRVCGEYISNEVMPFLKKAGLFPENRGLPIVSRFMLTSVNGKQKTLPLDLGGFGVSRFFFDHYLFTMAESAGVDFVLDTTVESIELTGQSFEIRTSATSYESDVVLGCFGKRSNLDLKLDRHFIRQRSPFVGVKYHARYDHPSDLISLHNFPGGYCGVCPVEDQKINLCYLVHRDKLKTHKSIAQLEANVLSKNPFLKDVFRNADFLFEKPETINEISFQPKNPLENHILMAGDAAGMITPLCGNGMAMAIHSAKLASDAIIPFCLGKIDRNEMETQYAQNWKKTFSRRLFAGRQIQNLFGSETASNIAVNIAIYVKPLAMQLIRSTHGTPFK